MQRVQPHVHDRIGGVERRESGASEVTIEESANGVGTMLVAVCPKAVCGHVEVIAPPGVRLPDGRRRRSAAGWRLAAWRALHEDPTREATLSLDGVLEWCAEQPRFDRSRGDRWAQQELRRAMRTWLWILRPGGSASHELKNTVRDLLDDSLMDAAMAWGTAWITGELSAADLAVLRD